MFSLGRLDPHPKWHKNSLRTYIKILLAAAQRGLPNCMSLHAIQTALHHGIRLSGMLSPSEALESSNASELLATLYTYQALLPFLCDLHINHHMDNLGAVQALGGIIHTYAEQIFGGSKTPRIQDIVIQIDDCCIAANINRHTIWVPRNLNIIADYMSKFGIGNAFSFTVQPWVRSLLDAAFGTHTVDHFAFRNNVQVSPPRYNSLFFEPEAKWLDAFSCRWAWGPQKPRDNNWIHPPYKLAGQVLQHLRLCQAQGTTLGTCSLVALRPFPPQKSYLFPPGAGPRAGCPLLSSQLTVWTTSPSTRVHHRPPNSNCLATRTSPRTAIGVGTIYKDIYLYRADAQT
jgi:hypothetical protein